MKVITDNEIAALLPFVSGRSYLGFLDRPHLSIASFDADPDIENCWKMSLCEHGGETFTKGRHFLNALLVFLERCGVSHAELAKVEWIESIPVKRSDTLNIVSEAPSGPLVYFITASNKDNIKIGCASCPEDRLDYLQTGSPVRLKLLGVMEGGRKKERELHNQFAHLRQHGEWFERSESLLNFIKANAR